MTQVSKYPLRKMIETRVYEIFLNSIVLIKSSHQAEMLLDDWLSPTEKIMLAKRLSIALLLMKKYDQRAITKLLRVGLETVSKVNRALQSGKGGYEQIVWKFIKEEKSDEFWQKIDDTLVDLFPPRHRNWSKWRRERWERKMASQKPF